MLREAGFDRDKLRCYVLVGFVDTVELAEARCWEIWSLGLTPFAMLWQPGGDRKERYNKQWRDFTRNWTRPAIIKARMKAAGGEENGS